MGLDFSNWDLGGNLDLPITIDAGTPDYTVGDGLPTTGILQDVPRSDGITVSGIFDGLNKTAQTGFDLFNKVYSLSNQVEDKKFSMEMNRARVDIAKAQAAGTLDVERARNDANIQLARMQAQRAVADAQAQVNSGKAGYVAQKAFGPTGSALVPLVLVAGVAYAFMKGARK